MRTNILLAALLCSTVTAGCGRTAADDDASATMIVGGSRVTASDAVTRSTVALMMSDGFVFCTGSLIAARYVVTAAHCLADYNRSKLYVAFGPTAASGTIKAAANWGVNARYDTVAMDADVAATAPGDIAMIKLASDAPGSATPIAMLAAGDALTTGEDLVLAGYGRTRYNATDGGLLYKVTASLTEVASAAKELHFGGHPGRSACMGDSGGPAFVLRGGALKLVGVTSRGSGICDEEGIYTDVRQYRSWITSAQRQL